MRAIILPLGLQSVRLPTRGVLGLRWGSGSKRGEGVQIGYVELWTY